MNMYQNGVKVLVLPDGAKCLMDDEEKNPLYIECPIGHEECTGDCEYYTEEVGDE